MSDTARANWSMSIALVVGALVTLPQTIAVFSGEAAPGDWTYAWVLLYLIFWPVFVVVFLAWTHLAYARRLPEPETKSSGIWGRLFEYGGPNSWTMMAAFIAVALTIVIAQDPVFRSDWMYVMLGMLTVACSWALMVYSFALRYCRLGGAVGKEGVQHISLGIREDPRFSDYLTLTILLSTMAATVSAKIQSREAWKTVRANVLFAFTFNTVIVAMMVSLMFGGLVN